MVLAGLKNGLPIIPTRYNVIKPALDLDPCLSRHQLGILHIQLSFSKRNRNYAGLTPDFTGFQVLITRRRRHQRRQILHAPLKYDLLLLHPYIHPYILRVMTS